QLLPKPVDADEPVVRDAEDQRRRAAPAVWVSMHDLSRLDEPSALGQVLDDLVGGLDRARAVKPAERLVEPAGVVHGDDHAEAQVAPELEVLGPRAGGDGDDAGSLVERHLVPGDDAMLGAAHPWKVVERPVVAQADEVLALDRPHG